MNWSRSRACWTVLSSEEPRTYIGWTWLEWVEGKIENSKGWRPVFAAFGIVYSGKQSGLEKLRLCVGA